MTIGFGFANEPILRLMNYSDQIMPDVKAYMGIIYAGLIVTAAYNSLAAFLRALGDSKSPLYFLIISAVINVGLDVAFIIYGGMGVEGCAYATVIAQGISAVLCLIYIIKKFPILHLKKRTLRFLFLHGEGFWHWVFRWHYSSLAMGCTTGAWISPAGIRHLIAWFRIVNLLVPDSRKINNLMKS